jgi:hypothetical protein
MKPMMPNTDFPSELPSRICSKLDQDFRSIFEHDRRNLRILSHYMAQISKRRLDIESAARAAAYDIVGKNKHEGAFKRQDQRDTITDVAAE